MRQPLAPMLFDDHDRAAAAAGRTSPVAKAKVSKQRRNPMRPPTFRVVPLAAWLTVRPKHRVVVRLHGNELLLNLRQQQLCFRQRQTQIGDLTKTLRPVD
jgi:hypothetical protein